MSTRKRPKIIVADDDAGIGRALEQRLRESASVFVVGDPVNLYAKVVEETPTFVFLDTKFGKSLDIVRELLAAQPQIMIVMLVGPGQGPLSQAGIKQGAYDALAKPIDFERLQTILRHGCDAHALKNRVAELESLIRNRDALDLLIGDSDVMRAMRQHIASLAPLTTSVLLHGEVGTQKELAAQALHERSSRRRGPLIMINATTLPSPLTERTLFGFEKGAFPGAELTQAGALDAAHGGTLVISEIHGLEPAAQMRVGKFLQDGTFAPLGGSKSRTVDVRLIATSSEDLAERVKQGRFRRDLLEHFEAATIKLPPLKARREDVPTLAQRALNQATARLGRGSITLGQGALEKLCQFEWPNNDQQLESIINRSVATLKGDEIDESALPAEVLTGLHVLSIASTLFSSTAFHDTNLKPIELVEKRAILDALARTGGHVGQASQLLGFGQATVYRKVKKYAITPDMRGSPKRGRKPKLRIAGPVVAT